MPRELIEVKGVEVALNLQFPFTNNVFSFVFEAMWNQLILMPNLAMAFGLRHVIESSVMKLVVPCIARSHGPTEKMLSDKNHFLRDQSMPRELDLQTKHSSVSHPAYLLYSFKRFLRSSKSCPMKDLSEPSQHLFYCSVWISYLKFILYILLYFCLLLNPFQIIRYLAFLNAFILLYIQTWCLSKYIAKQCIYKNQNVL